MEGFLNIYKPEGITSADVVRVIKRELRVKKVGYIGTLDPMATGVLPIGMGRATKLFPFLEKDKKEYDAVMTLGSSTDTQDRTGKVLNSADPSAITEEQVKEVMKSFAGEIEQVPPMFSAKKVQGERLYDLARQGIEIERQPVKVTVRDIKFISKEGEKVRFTVKVSPGTYVRTLCHDIGEKLGVYAHLSDLTRTASGSFGVESSIPLEEIRSDNLEKVESSLLSFTEALANMSLAVVIPHAVDRIRNGMPLGVSDIVRFEHVPENTHVRIVDKQENLVSIGVMGGVPMAGFPFSSIQPKKVLG